MSAWAGGETVGGWGGRATSKVGVTWDAVLVASDVGEAFTEAKTKNILPNTKMITAIKARLRGMAVNYTHKFGNVILLLDNLISMAQ